jgi:hypothetical protein
LVDARSITTAISFVSAPAPALTSAINVSNVGRAAAEHRVCHLRAIDVGFWIKKRSLLDRSCFRPRSWLVHDAHLIVR